MFFSKREMHSYLSLVEVDIRKGSSGRNGRIESESELSHHNLTLILHNPVINLLKFRREVGRWEDSTILYLEAKRFCNNNREVIAWKRINKNFS
jgi:hypothetical protein